MSGECRVSPGIQLTSPDELVDVDKLNQLARPAVRLEAGAVTARELADGAITADKLDVNLEAQLGVEDNSVTTNKLVNGAVTESKLAEESVSGGKLTNGFAMDFDEAADVDEGDFSLWHRVAQGGPMVRVKLAALKALPYALMQDVQASGTNGGTFGAGVWVTRSLNTVKINHRNAVTSLAGNEWVLPAGRWLMVGRAPGHSCGVHRVRLWSVSDGEAVAYGTTERAQANAQTASVVHALVELDGAKTFRLEHRCGTTQNNTGLGSAANFGVDEVYAEVEVYRIF